jgi:cyclophilin family peptidyl-prolyl cis-trans isomerase
MKNRLLLICGCIFFICSGLSNGNPQPYPMVAIYTRFGIMIVKLYNETPKHRDNFLKLVREKQYDSLLFHRIIPGFMIQGGDIKSKYAPKDSLIGDGELGYTIPAEFNPKLFHKRGALAAARNDNPEKASNGSQFYIVQGGVPIPPDQLANIENQVNFGAKGKMFSSMLQSDSMKPKYEDFVLRGDKEGLRNFMMKQQDVIDKIYAPYEFKFSKEQYIAYTIEGGAPHLDGEYTVFGEIVSGIQVVDSIAAQPRDGNNRPLKDIRIFAKLVKQN